MREPIYPQTALEFFNKLLFYLYKIDIVTWKLRRSHEDNVELRDIGWKQPKRNNSRRGRLQWMCNFVLETWRGPVDGFAANRKSWNKRKGIYGC